MGLLRKTYPTKTFYGQAADVYVILMNIKAIQDVIAIFMSVAMIGATITTGIMYLAAKMHGYTPVGVHVKSKWSINLDIKFFF